MNKTYIYGLIDPITDEIRYVGKSDDIYHRYYDHLREVQDPIKGDYHSKNWIRSLFIKGFAPKLKLIECCDKDKWHERESYWIKYYKELGIDLTNMTKGGDGGGMLGKPAPNRTQVNVFTLTGILVKSCMSLKEAEELTGVHNGKISAICKRKRNRGRGYVFRYIGDDFSYDPGAKIRESKKCIYKEIYELDSNLNIINKFAHSQLIADLYKISRSNISYVCNNPFFKKIIKLRSVHGKYFVYKENYEDIVRSLEKSKSEAISHATE